ncbi:MAG: CinA family nicotinamide mononucleotide deamidase-related protein [Planctomycetes bacterium]|nr:CinA family nicotinamide mononucleotide deamidase-related protein [Planctomycetota bacterium]
MRAAIVSIGHELITGQTVDTNAAWLAAQLVRRGTTVVRHTTVGDGVDEIEQAIRQVIADADLVVCTGGLGPTADDRTRQALARAIGRPLETNDAALAEIRAFFERWERPMTASDEAQALIPAGCSHIPNARGTAPGIDYQGPSARLFALPGVPVEMKAMYRSFVEPHVSAKAGKAASVSARLLCIGISEAKLGDALSDMMEEGRNPSVGTTATEGVISVRVVASGRDRASADELLHADLREIRNRLSDRVIFGEGEDTLEGVVGRMLSARCERIATAESCTGGLLAKRLTDVPGSSAYFSRGVVAYANEAKVDLLGVSPGLIEQHGAVSEAVGRAMAEGCRRSADTDYAISITGIAGPSGGSSDASGDGLFDSRGGESGPVRGDVDQNASGTVRGDVDQNASGSGIQVAVVERGDKPVGLVFIGLADRRAVIAKRFLFGAHLSRADIRDRSCKTALNLLRRRLLGIDTW